MSFIYDTTSFIARTYQSASLLHSEMPGISAEVARINRHWIEGFTIEDTRSGGEVFNFTFDARLRNEEIVERFNLGGGGFFMDLFDTFRFLTLDRNALVFIDNEDFEGVQKVYPIIKPAALTSWMFNVFQAINFYCLMVAIILTIVVWTYFNLMFNFSFRRWIEQLYGKKVAGQNIPVSTNMQEHFKEFISGENEMASLGKATQKLTHDFRNVLATIQLIADRLETSDDKNSRVSGERITRSLEKATLLCDLVLKNTMRADTTLERRLELVGPMVQNVFSITRLHDLDKVVRLKNFCPEGVQIDCDPKLFFRILYNIVLNAVQAIQMDGRDVSSGQGRISISSKRMTHGCEVNIRDNGPGISEEKVEKLFSNEMRSTKEGGSGLGLSIAHDLVNLHGGTIELLYTGNTGSCFKIYIPDTQNPKDADDRGEGFSDNEGQNESQIVA